MRGKGLARGRALIACAIGGLGLLVAGCGPTTAASTSVKGSTLTIYLSAAPGRQTDNRTQDVLDAERLAFQQSGGHVAGFQLKLKVLHASKLSDNARTAIQDKTTIAYLGEIIPGESADSVGIVTDQQILQVSPTDTAVELTQHSAAVPGSPDIYYETSGSASHVFARVVPTTALEARALLADARALNVSKLYVASDGQAYGAALAAAVRKAATTGPTVMQGTPTAAAFSAAGADGLLLASADPARAAKLLDAVAAANGSAKLFVPSALDDQQFAASLSPAAQHALQVSSPGFTSAQLTASGQQFQSAFAAAYGHQPQTQAIFGYEAMSAVLAVLRQAGSKANDRGTVIRDFFSIHNRASVLGTYSINANGDTNLAPFVISHITGGSLTPYRFVSEQG